MTFETGAICLSHTGSTREAPAVGYRGRVNQARDRGRDKRRSLTGSATPGKAATGELAPFFSDWVLDNVFGDLWSRPALGDKTRVMITMTALATREQQHQLRGYVSAALRVGWTREEIVEALVHLAPYAGVPAVHNAIATAREAFEEEE